MFTLDQVRGFIAVADELHFGRAAALLHMTQPPLSRQIQRLEELLGARLLDRDQRSVRLTAAGEAFLVDARRLLVAAESAAERTRGIANGSAGSVRLAFTAGAALGVLPAVLDVTARTLPDVDLDLVEMVTTDQVHHVQQGTIDVGLGRPTAANPGVEARLVHREDLLLAVPAGHRWTERPDRVSVAELVDEPLIMYSATAAHYFHDLVKRLIPAPGPTVAYTVTQVLTMLTLVAAGRGVALVPASTRSLHPDGLALLPLRDAPSAPVELHVLWSREGSNPAGQAVVARVLDALAAAPV